MNLFSTRNQWMMSFGMLLGVFYGIVLKLSIMAFNTASFILYGSPYTIPLWAAILISSLAYVLLITSEWWGPMLVQLVIDMYHVDESGDNE